jgi:SAM-dependent methyltransferase
MSIDKLKLKELYSRRSKHSNYQTLPKRLAEIIGDDIEIKTRYETERLAYILENIDVKNKSMLDIGGNTGYFTFEMLERGARSVHYYEGDKTHAEFVKIASKHLDMKDKLKITDEYFSFINTDYKDKYDIILLLNVLHHIGDDYGDKTTSIEKAKKTIIEQLNSLAELGETIVFQLGFNWKGNREICLFEGGTKTELIDFIKDGTERHWEICKIGIAESQEGGIKYCDANLENMRRLDSLGEFLNRPIIIMRSLK